MLNQEQIQAVHATDGPVRIIAGVGTGKTFTIINRIDHLISNKKVDPTRILTITFTNKAAHELKERLEAIGHNGVCATTFHSLASKLLRKCWNKDFKIINSREQEETLASVLQDSEVKKLGAIKNDIDSLRESKVLKNDLKITSTISKKRLDEILSKYEECLSEQNSLDFSALLTGLSWIFQDSTQILKKCQDLFDFILVDEYQDVNDVQIELLKKMAAGHGNICAVGDEDQTIYSWRGAKASSMADFEKNFPGTKSISLIKNYRNPPAILKGAQDLISHNKQRFEKKLEAEVVTESKISLWEGKTEFRLNESLTHLLEKYLGGTSGMIDADELDVGLDEDGDFRALSEIAIIYRTQHEGEKIAEFLTKKGLPYQISSSKYFWDHKEVTSFIDGISGLKKFGIKTSKKFSEWISAQIDLFIENGKFTKTQKNRLNHLISYAIAFDVLPVEEAFHEFLDEVKTEMDADNLVYSDRINLLTLHACKGLQFPIVIILGLEAGLIPHKKSENVEEERRLLYVGMTRAKEDLHLFYNQKNKRSKFLGEIGVKNIVSQCLPEKKRQRIKKKEFKKAQLQLF